MSEGLRTLRCPRCLKQFKKVAGSAAESYLCPHCGAEGRISSAMAVSSGPPTTNTVRWFVMDEEEETYGPVSTEDVENWIAEGSVTRECQVMREGSDQWQWAGDIFAIAMTPYSSEMPVADTGGGFDIFAGGGGGPSYSSGSSRSSKSDSDDRPQRKRKSSGADMMMYILIGGAVLSVVALVFLLMKNN